MAAVGMTGDCRAQVATDVYILVKDLLSLVSNNLYR